MSEQLLSLDNLQEIIEKALIAHNTTSENARSVSESLVMAEADGQKGHGLSRLESYCSQVATGKVNGSAKPQAYWAADAVSRIDADHGFAYPALFLAKQKLIEIANTFGLGVASVFNSHHCGVAGHHVEYLAREGFVAMLFANTPKAIAPWGGSKPVFGTNPIAFAAPSKAIAKDPIVIDLSLSKVARGKIMYAKQKGEKIPENWALDLNGKPTTDPNEALIGSMLPMGDAKGAALVVMVEILTSALTGANLSYKASSFFTAEGPSPDVGQLLMAFSPDVISGGKYTNNIEEIINVIQSQENTRLPGERRFQQRRQAQRSGLNISTQQYNKLIELSKIKL
ncbi:MAG: Ldh family oxidoreductase [Petrotogales bacterium]